MTDHLMSQQTSRRSRTDRCPALDPALARSARRLAAEGATLLRNDAGADGVRPLPLTGGESVALLGRGQLDWIAVGYGSGGDVNAPYVTNLLDCLAEVGVQADGELASLYRAWCAAHPVDPGEVWGQWPLSFPEMELAQPALEAAARRCRSAVVVIGRAAGEDRESLLEAGSYYLTEVERSLLERARGAFERVIAVVVTGNVMDLSWAEELGVDALLLAWCGGMEGARAIARVLAGDDEPGGRLTSTIAYRYEDYPSAGNFGDPEAADYVEDIYVGYRYFETFDPEAVQYPFGFGLGYGTHEITAGPPVLNEHDVTVAVRARSTGERASSAVVQLYVSKPCVPLGNPVRELVAFARTPLLAPGQTWEGELRVPLCALASYDDSGATGQRSAWVLQGGSYAFHVGADVRSAEPVGAVEVSATRVLAQLEQACAPDPAHPLRRMTRTVGDDGARALGWEDAPVSEVDLRERILDRLPTAVPAVDGGVRFQQVVAGERSLDDLLASLDTEALARLTYGDTEMDSSYGPPGNAGALGGVNEVLRAVGIPAAITTDGPSGLRLAATASLLPCGTALASTWDPEAVGELATLHGQEMIRLGSDILLSPGMNIHRDPLCGRNFEYFSEDPLLTGAMGAAVVVGVQSTGRSACPKHFAANNQETNRIHTDSRVSERALREIYLRAFEHVVRQARPDVIMTSYNKVNGVWSHYGYDLVTTVLRGEWGYEGLVITDWWMRMASSPEFPTIHDSGYRVRSGVDVLMPGGDAHSSSTREDGVMDGYRAWIAAGGEAAGREAAAAGLSLGEIQAAARHVLRLLVKRARA